MMLGKRKAVIVDRLSSYNPDGKLSCKEHVDRIKADMGMFGMVAEYVSRGDSNICVGWKMEERYFQEILGRSDVGMALSLVNKELTSSKDALMQLFHYEDCGWIIPVEIDWDREYIEEQDLGCIDGSVVDVLGRYYTNYAKISEDSKGYDPNMMVFVTQEMAESWSKKPAYSYTENRKIVIYAKAIHEFATVLSPEFFAISSLKNLTAYVLAHEVFHAFQDFHLNFAEYQGGKHGPYDVEPYAEFFALRFVKNVLKDNGLFELLVNCREKQENHRCLKPYSLALSQFGNICNPDSEVCFARALDNIPIWGSSSVVRKMDNFRESEYQGRNRRKYI